MILVICSYFLIVFVLKCLLFSSHLGCGNDVMFNGRNLDRLHLTQPAKLISNYGVSLQIRPSLQTQNWSNRLKACGGICLCCNTTAKFFFLSCDSNTKKKKNQTSVGSGISIKYSESVLLKIDCDYIIIIK